MALTIHPESFMTPVGSLDLLVVVKKGLLVTENDEGVGVASEAFTVAA
jgi:hypothetical protein